MTTWPLCLSSLFCCGTGIFCYRKSFQLTFVLVGLGLHAQDGHDGDDDDNGGGGQGHNEPGLPMEGLGLRVAILQVNLGRGGDLGTEGRRKNKAKK